MHETKLFAVAGNPVLHSLSPEMHNAAFAAIGEDAVYFRLLAASASEALSVARKMGVKGISVTAPFKEEMLALADGLDGNADAIGAVNTLSFKEDGDVQGSNTDTGGASGALLANGVELSGCKAVVLGAGGAAKAAVHALISNGAKVTVANRTMAKAQEIAKQFTCRACSLEKSELETVLVGADVIVSTISADERVVPAELLRKELVVLDAVYGKETSISSDAKARGCRVIGGREWLLYQGAAAFEIFTGKKAPVEEMRKAIDDAGRKAQGNAAGADRKTAGPNRNIALVGFMGSGKSTTAKEIAQASGMALVEIDDEIIASSGKSISEIFETNGEAHFRKLEQEAIAGIGGRKNCVVSCGGGAVLDEANRKALGENCIVVWLFASAKETVARLKDDRSRPLMDRKDRLEAARGIMGRRMKLYASCCDFALSTEGKTPKEVAKMIMAEIGKGK